MNAELETNPHWNPQGGRVVRLENGRLAQVCKIKAPRRASPTWGWERRYAIRWLDTGEYEPCTPAKILARVTA